MAQATGSWGWLSRLTPAVISVLLVPNLVEAQGATGPTFARDIAPIFQEKCQVCHRPGSIAPMSLLTYEETRPWARSIRTKVARREMPPWHLDKTVGIQKFKNDRSLSDQQIDTIVRWVDTGAALGNPRDLPPPQSWPNEDVWMIGKPDLIVTFPEDFVTPAWGPDWWGDVIAETGLTEDRYIKAIETKPSREGRRVVHHSVASILPPDWAPVARAGGSVPVGGERLSEYAVGKYGDVYPDGTGRLLKAGSKISFNMHYHSIGEEIRDRTSLGIVFYPKGVVPKYKVWELGPGSNDLDIPPNTVTRHDAYEVVEKPSKVITFQPHMHMRGRAMTVEAIYPDGRTEILNSVDRFDFNWHVSYVYDDDAAPLLPAGTILHSIAIHDNTASHPGNPDPNMWVGWGSRSIDDMNNNHMLYVELDQEEFDRQVAERKAKAKSN